MAVISLTALPGSVLATRWPFYMAFHFARHHRPAGLHPVRQPLQAGPGEWAGIYRVWGTIPGITAGEIGLLIDPNTRGQFAFVRRRTPLVGTASGPEGVDGLPWYSIDQD